MVGNAAGLTVMVLETGASALPHASVAVQVSVTVPPQAAGVSVNVEVADVPLISHPPLNPLLKLMVLASGIASQSPVILGGAVMVGNVAGLTVMVLDTGSSALPQASVAVQVSVTVPPHAPGVVVNVEETDVPLIRHPPLAPLV